MVNNFYYKVAINKNLPFYLIYDYHKPLKLYSLCELRLKNKTVLGIILKQVKKPNFTTNTILKPKEEITLSKDYINFLFELQKVYNVNLNSIFYKTPILKYLNKLDNKNFLKKLKITDFNLNFNLKNLNLNKFQFDFFEKFKNNYKKPILLYSKTGAGKSYLLAYITIWMLLELKKSSLLILPEILLSYTFQSFFPKNIQDRIIIYNSDLTFSKKAKIAAKLKLYSPFIVLSTRSGIYLDIKDLGAILIDEFQDESLKESSFPYFNVNELALIKAKTNKEPIKVVLSSATPKIEYLYNSIYKSKFDFFYLKSFKRSKIRTTVIENKEKTAILTDKLVTKILNSPRCLIFINKKGYSNLKCSVCNAILRCKNCDIAMSYYKTSKIVMCNVCGYKIKKGEVVCKFCKSRKFEVISFGTEKVVDVLKMILTNKKIIQIDNFTLKNKKEKREVLTNLEKLDFDIIVGTQIITKGHNLPNINLAVALNIDSTINLADFRAFEKAVEFITQTKGRLIRGTTDVNEAEFVIQTFNYPKDFIQNNFCVDFIEFFKKELKRRAEFNLPPFTTLIKCTITKRTKNLALTHSLEIFNILKTKLKNFYDFIGLNDTVFKIKSKFSCFILIKTKKPLIFIKYLNFLKYTKQKDLVYEIL